MKRNQRDFHSVEHLLKFHIQLQAISSLRERTEYVGGTTMYPVLKSVWMPEQASSNMCCINRWEKVTMLYYISYRSDINDH